jgi:hypothetical protein
MTPEQKKRLAEAREARWEAQDRMLALAIDSLLLGKPLAMTDHRYAECVGALLLERFLKKWTLVNASLQERVS